MAALPSIESIIDELEREANLSYSVRDIPRGYICSFYMAWKIRNMKNVDPLIKRICDDIFTYNDLGNQELFGLLEDFDSMELDENYAKSGK